MAEIKIIHGNAIDHRIVCDLIFTDPPFDMHVGELNAVLSGIECDHLLLITTMRQLIDLVKISEWVLRFDFVLDTVVPKKSNSIRRPHYTHSTGVYMTKNKASSIFNRKLRERSDTFDGKGYWPTVLRATRDRMKDYGVSKNIAAVTDIIGSFDVKHICDPFAGSGTTGIACLELGIKCTLIDIDINAIDLMEETFNFLK